MAQLMPGAPWGVVLAMACAHVRGVHVPTTPRPGARLQQRTLQTGGPFDFSDYARDLAAEEVLGELSRSAVGNRTAQGASDAAVHFFTESDCPLFTSPEACAKARRAVTYLASYPCSGNTWARALFEQTLLIYTGSVFHDSTLVKAGMRGEGQQDPGRVFLVKTHWPKMGAHTEGGEIRNLAVVREPLHAVLSYCHFDLTYPDHHREVPKDKLQKQFDETVEPKLRRWAEMARNYSGRSDTHVVRYEDMVADTRRAYLEDIFPYLDVNPSHPDISARLSAAVARADKATTTTKRQHSYTFEFTDHHRELARKIVGSTLAAKFGYQL